MYGRAGVPSMGFVHPFSQMHVLALWSTSGKETTKVLYFLHLASVRSVSKADLVPNRAASLLPWRKQTTIVLNLYTLFQIE